MKPYVHVNCAMSADGKIAGTDRKQVTISSPEDKARVKELRKKYDAILVGIGTILADNPHLTIKGEAPENNPVRIVIDPHGKCPDDALVVNDAATTYIITLDSCTKKWRNAQKISYEKIDLGTVLEDLWKKGICSILVEGGGKTIASFFKEGLVDRYSVFVGNILIGGHDSPTPIDGEGWIRNKGIILKVESMEKLGHGVLLTYLVE